MAGILYVVGTPIGNLSDFSPRAVETLNMVDFIAAEDTRVTVKLLNNLGIKTPMISYHEHNMTEREKIITDRILAGENCAIVTDAGMPCISDPGEMLVKKCAELDIKVLAVPGPSAVVTALAVSGLNTGRFTFEGFLSVNKKSRLSHLESLIGETRTMIFYEAPHKLPQTLIDMYKYFGDRKISLVRELTKIHEEVIRTTLEKAVNDFTNGSLKGEMVLVIEGAQSTPDKAEYTISDATEFAMELLEKGFSKIDAAKQAAKMTGIKKGDIYKEILDKG